MTDFRLFDDAADLICATHGSKERLIVTAGAWVEVRAKLRELEREVLERRRLEQTAMTEEEALGLAAQAWCGPKTEQTVMDPDLAREFARKLQEVHARAVRSCAAMIDPSKLMIYEPSGNDPEQIQRACQDEILKLLDPAPAPEPEKASPA